MPTQPWQSLLPFMRIPMRAAAPLLGMGVLVVIQAVTGLPGLSWLDGIAIVVLTTIASMLPHASTPQSWAPGARCAWP